ncbi:MAG TPA: DUF3499 family protein [Actinomycetota bacterium]|nr:DUF3499 family protein [Actinomycetota bacterium]
MNHCSKPRCTSTATTVLAYDYSSRQVALDDFGDEPLSPHLYVLCRQCADRLRAPLGWELLDRRVVVLDEPQATPFGFSGAGSYSTSSGAPAARLLR